MIQDVDFTEQSPVILSLCPGIRGLERGLERVFRSVRVAAYVEIETVIVENLLSSMEAGLVDAAPVWTNLKTFNPQPFRNRIDGIIGGYPCQPFSLAGNRAGVEDPRHLWPYISKAIKEIRPLWCFFENVSGHLSMGYPEVYRSLRDMGYLVESDIYTASEVGASHRRERLFILAIMENASCFGGGRRDNGSSQRNECTGEAQGSVGTLEYTDGGGLRGIDAGGFRPEVIGTGEKLGNSESIDQRNDRNESRECSQPDRGPGIELANSDSERLEVRKEQSPRHKPSTTKRNSSQLANPDIIPRGLSESERRNEGPEVERISPELAHSNNNGQNGSENRESDRSGNDRSSPGTEDIFKPSGRDREGNRDRFPAGQGEFQYEWEEPRTIESSLVYTIDGYNFTEDLHRAIGNSVVEQQAEFAARDLIRKHLESWQSSSKYFSS
jgi:site-specific DNA-cytosine methylase